MPTIKQVEAFFWAGKLGSLIAASGHLNTTQSNVSKRIIELEQRLGTSLFDRVQRGIRLTPQGRSLMIESERLLRQHAALVQSCLGESAYVGEYRFGVLESVGLTWLPDLIAALRARYPRITPFPDINTTSSLLERLKERKLEIAIVTQSPDLGHDLSTVPLASLRIGLFGQTRLVEKMKPLRIADLPTLPIVANSQRSGMLQVLHAFMRERNIRIDPIITSNGLSVTSHLAASGAGFVFLPRDVAFPDLMNGYIREVPLDEELPIVRYVAAYRSDDLTSMSRDVGMLAASICNFAAQGG